MAQAHRAREVEGRRRGPRRRELAQTSLTVPDELPPAYHRNIFKN
jgi:hypothetical protein